MPFDGGARYLLEIAAADKTAAAFASVDKRMRDLQSGTTTLSGLLKNKFGELQKSLKESLDAGKDADSLGSLLPLLTKVGPIAAAAGAAYLSFRAGLKVGELKDQAEQIGLTTDQLQAYRLAALQGGVSNETLDGAFVHLARAMGEAKAGNADIIALLDKLGVKILDSKGQLIGVADAMPGVARGLLNIASGTERSADMMTLLGKSGSRLTTVLADVAQGNDALTASGKVKGGIASEETIDAWNKLSTQMEISRDRSEKLLATLGAPVVMVWLNNLNVGLDLAARTMEAIKSGAQWLTGNVPGSIQSKLQSQIDAANGDITAFIARGYKNSDPALQEIIQKRDALQEELDKHPITLPTVTVTGDAGGGVSNPTPKGAGDRDRIGEELRRLTAQVDSARDAYQQLQAAAATASSTEDLQRQVNLQKAIGDELARIGKYSANDPRIPQLKQIITEHETWEYRLKSLDAALKAADATEKQFGDGTAELRRRQTELNEALATGRLSQDAYAAASKAAAMAQEDQALKAHQYDDGLSGLVAGVEFAALQAKRAGSSFNQGMQLWQGAIDPVKSELDQLANGAEFSFGRIALAWAKMLSNMAFTAATNQIGSALFGGASGGGGGLGGLIGGLLGLGGASSAGGMASAGVAGSSFFGPVNPFFGPGFATGGQPPVGTPYLVGERGPEVRVDGQPGQIFNRGQWNALGGNGAGNGITIMVTGDTDLVRVTAQDEAGRAIAVSGPQIEGRAVKRSTQLAPAAVARDKQMRSTDWRLGRD